MDDNYPPYIFRDSNGNIQGILVDEWALWEKKTGIKVNLIAMDWSEAQDFFLKGQADAIDTIFFNEKRARQFDFTKPYATIDVPVFFHKNISGIVDIASLQGFTIGVKAGDACIEVLKKQGITGLKEYSSYEEIVKAAADHQINVFSIDKPPAVYYLHKMGLENEFRYSLNLYTGEFHRAVIKGRTDILKVVEDGFALITEREHERIDKKWMGESFVRPMYLRHALFFFLFVGLIFSVLIFFNITLRRKVRSKTSELQDIVNQLRLSEEKYRILVENAGEAIFVAQDGMLKFFNSKSQEMTGYTRDELTSTAFIELVHPDDREMVLDRHIRRLRSKEVDSGYPFRIIHRSGDTLWVRISAVQIDWEGKAATLNFLSDITARKQAEAERQRLEERLQQAEKMEALGTLAGGVAHDLNNVLGVVVGYAELLLDDVEVSSPLRCGLETIMSGGQKAAAIIQDLLTLARRGVPGRSVLNLNKIIVSNLNSPEFEKLSSHHPGVRIRTTLEPDLLNIAGSHVHLGKTFFNLVSNAAEAMPGGGVLTIETANRYLDKPVHGYDEIREGDYVVLSVSDTGEGIHAADLKRIFEPFYTKKVMGRSGTGLGLAVVWGTVKDHHGYINVQSEEGRGSTFTLYFPVTREDLAAEAVSTPVSEYMGKGESILVVDDVKDQRDLATTMLRKLHYNVENVSSGEEALAYLKANPVDLMVLDMIMDPGMDGLDTYRGVLEIHPKQKAIIVSGFSESERVIAAQALGAGAYVRKPYVMEKLGLAVKKELERAARFEVD